MRRRFDEYKHLNGTDKFAVELDIEEIAARIVAMNYGTHRLLCALVRKLEIVDAEDEIAKRLRQIIDDGLF